MTTFRETYVWDLFVRLFHWSLALFFIAAYATGDDACLLHRYTGYVILGLIACRIVWGFIGTKHARFASFLCPPGQAFTYLKSLAIGKPQHYVGHNPAAAWMVVLFLTCIPVVCLSGYATYVATNGNSPILSWDSFALINNAHADQEGKRRYTEKDRGKDNGLGNHGKERKEHGKRDTIWKDIHEISAGFTLLLVFLHIGGVALSSRAHNENLVNSMITGKKTLHSL